MTEIGEEIEILSSIYCQPGEFCLEQQLKDEAQFTVKLKDGDNKVVFSCHVPREYPFVPPIISVQEPQLKRSQQLAIKESLHLHLHENNLIGEAMLCEVIAWLKNYIFVVTEQIKLSEQDAKTLTPDNYTCLMQLDHMRARNKYTRLLQAWACELALVGALIFFRRLIFIILEGGEGNVKEFIVRQRTQKVDVDSSGRACKEKMLRIFGEVHGTNSIVTGFEVVEIDSKTELQSYLNTTGLDFLYTDYLKSLVE